MKNTILCLTVIHISSFITHGADVNSPCGDGWIPYKDEKCVKLFTSFESRHQAEAVCYQQHSTLVIINSAAEQKFLIEYIFNTSDSNIVWIGAERQLDSSTEFVWNDGSPVQRFTNWQIGRPSNVVSRSCVQMQSIWSRDLSQMEWVDVSCTIGNWFICEKLQAWPIERFQQAIISMRRELADTQNTLNAQTIQVQALQANPVPIDFIYVQLPNQPEPQNIWDTVEWIEITSEYAGLFFRAEGGDSAAFGTIQADNSPRLHRVGRTNIAHPGVNGISVRADGVSSSSISSGALTDSTHWALHFTVTSGEVRPRNQAMRIWKRI